nr:MAG TPA: hypothetical protein [Caudoviricetes sp.]
MLLSFLLLLSFYLLFLSPFSLTRKIYKIIYT